MEQEQNKRSIKELLEFLYQEVEKNGVKLGLCSVVPSLYYTRFISRDERWVLYEYIGSNRPDKYSSLAAFMARNTVYYWPKGKAAPRLKWLKNT